MGSSSSKQDIMARLDELDKKEFEMNLKLKEMQNELNGMVPKNERIKINKDLTKDSKIIRAYDVLALGKSSSKKVGGKKSSSKLRKIKDENKN